MLLVIAVTGRHTRGGLAAACWHCLPWAATCSRAHPACPALRQRAGQRCHACETGSRRQPPGSSCSGCTDSCRHCGCFFAGMCSDRAAGHRVCPWQAATSKASRKLGAACGVDSAGIAGVPLLSLRVLPAKGMPNPVMVLVVLLCLKETRGFIFMFYKRETSYLCTAVKVSPGGKAACLSPR